MTSAKKPAFGRLFAVLTEPLLSVTGRAGVLLTLRQV
jgi:hypothetical protein